ncbi:MAG: hypothetical protein ACRD2G_08560 [Terriglobia bacterium]
MALLPAPNSWGTLDTKDNLLTHNFLEAGSSAPGHNEYTGGIDQDFGPNTRIFGSVTHYDNVNPVQPNIPGPLDSAVGASNDGGTQIALYLTHTLTPNRITELNAGFERDNPLIQPPPGSQRAERLRYRPLRGRRVAGLQTSTAGAALDSTPIRSASRSITTVSLPVR